MMRSREHERSKQGECLICGRNIGFGSGVREDFDTDRHSYRCPDCGDYWATVDGANEWDSRATDAGRENIRSRIRVANERGEQLQLETGNVSLMATKRRPTVTEEHQRAILAMGSPDVDPVMLPDYMLTDLLELGLIERRGGDPATIDFTDAGEALYQRLGGEVW